MLELIRTKRSGPKMKLGGFIFTALVSAIFGAVLSYSAHDRIKALIDPPQEPLIAIVALANSCQVPDSAFVVIDLETGLKVPFVNSNSTESLSVSPPVTRMAKTTRNHS